MYADIVVEIKESYKKKLPFGSALTRNAIRIILSYTCWRDEIIALMQCISHTTRAYAVYHQILIRTLIESVPCLLRKVPQQVKNDVLSLQYLNYLELQLQLKEQQSYNNQLAILEQHSPGLAYNVVKRFSEATKLCEYQRKWFACQDDASRFTQFIHGYWFPYLENLRSANKLTKGATTLKEGKCYWHYTGELDEQGEACGLGVAVLVDDARWSYRGTFLSNERHGFGVYSIEDICKWESEYRMGQKHGKATYFDSTGTNIKNYVFIADEKQSIQDVTFTPHLAYYRDGRAQKALGT